MMVRMLRLHAACHHLGRPQVGGPRSGPFGRWLLHRLPLVHQPPPETGKQGEREMPLSKTVRQYGEGQVRFTCPGGGGGQPLGLVLTRNFLSSGYQPPPAPRKEGGRELSFPETLCQSRRAQEGGRRL